MGEKSTPKQGKISKYQWKTEKIKGKIYSFPSYRLHFLLFQSNEKDTIRKTTLIFIFQITFILCDTYLNKRQILFQWYHSKIESSDKKVKI